MNAETLCFDLGGTGLKCGLVTAGNVQKFTVIPTDVSRGAAGIRDTVERGLHRFADDRYAAVGFSTAGRVGDSGVVEYATPNLPGYVGFPLASFVEARTNRPCAALNDGEAALLGELYDRGGEGSTAMLTIGTGVGGGYARDGKIVPPARPGPSDSARGRPNLHLR